MFYLIKQNIVVKSMFLLTLDFGELVKGQIHQVLAIKVNSVAIFLSACARSELRLCLSYFMFPDSFFLDRTFVMIIFGMETVINGLTT